VAFSLLSLRYQQLPPCVGLNDPDFDLNFVKTTYKSQTDFVLCFSFGFGGQNAVIALGKV
jgi:3-oxoacyl-[acyl-carrier-protein] synthase II